MGKRLAPEHHASMKLLQDPKTFVMSLGAGIATMFAYDA